MKGITPTEKFIAWAKKQDEKKLAWVAGGALLGALILTTAPLHWVARAALGSAVIAGAYYKGGRTTSLRPTVKMWGRLFGAFVVLHLANVWLGSYWWGLLFVVATYTAYKIWRLRVLVRMWWAWYKQYLKAAWRGELRNKSFSERVEDAMRGRNQ